jgi:hypothetical protein
MGHSPSRRRETAFAPHVAQPPSAGSPLWCRLSSLHVQPRRAASQSPRRPSQRSGPQPPSALKIAKLSHLSHWPPYISSAIPFDARACDPRPPPPRETLPRRRTDCLIPPPTPHWTSTLRPSAVPANGCVPRSASHPPLLERRSSTRSPAASHPPRHWFEHSAPQFPMRREKPDPHVRFLLANAVPPPNLDQRSAAALPRGVAAHPTGRPCHLVLPR